eukprot:TRINITY_DN55110_c0_g1_i1.p3 TRINITY_DN55110_c0_g1~~TRINITY_DN55110_c0_g1_i1.p3  ORF type:complete len:115 (+),score=29.58 TRINITY_DN55110_c0_g1_i1:109-453(+)
MVRKCIAYRRAGLVSLVIVITLWATPRTVSAMSSAKANGRAEQGELLRREVDATDGDGAAAATTTQAASDNGTTEEATTTDKPGLEPTTTEKAGAVQAAGLEEEVAEEDDASAD